MLSHSSKATEGQQQGLLQVLSQRKGALTFSISVALGSLLQLLFRACCPAS